ncbi:hypothetical protein NPIL_215651 [Nephila pilipes]|uniref:Uncharacterized protein n=1 Tax=Nephila pilipes TaxID=299642 RepID=A0A8X6NFA6_NEPPI|nr:hypothetical protein NPIL_215651 [Nephila pilipes]
MRDSESRPRGKKRIPGGPPPERPPIYGHRLTTPRDLPDKRPSPSADVRVSLTVPLFASNELNEISSIPRNQPVSLFQVVFKLHLGHLLEILLKRAFVRFY